MLGSMILSFYACALLSVMCASFLHPEGQEYFVCIMLFCALLLQEA